MKRVAKCVLLAVMVLGVAASTQTDLGSPEVWRVVQDPFGAVYPVLLVTRVIDGDTFEAWVHIAPRLAYFADVRLAGVDTPEVTGECRVEGLRVRDQVERVLRGAREITVRVTDVDSYGRWVCHVLFDGRDLAQWIRDNRLTKGDLCP